MDNEVIGMARPWKALGRRSLCLTMRSASLQFDKKRVVVSRHERKRILSLVDVNRIYGYTGLRTVTNDRSHVKPMAVAVTCQGPG